MNRMAMLMKENALCRMSIRKSHKSWGVDYSSYGMTGVKSPFHLSTPILANKEREFARTPGYNIYCRFMMR